MENFTAVWTHEADSGPAREVEFCFPVHKDVVNYARQFCLTSQKKVARNHIFCGVHPPTEQRKD